jgi:phosphoserine phosphatase
MFLIYIIDNKPINQELIENFELYYSASISTEFTELSNKRSKTFKLDYYCAVLKCQQRPNKLNLYKTATEYNVDAFYIDENFKLDEIKILAIDMDSTLINIECIDEIADLAGVKEEVSRITKETMQGKITDFSESLRKRVAFLKGINLSLLDEIYDKRLKLSNGAENLIKYMHNNQVYTMLVSGGFTFFSDKLKNRLNLNQAHSNQLSIKNGILTGEVNGIIVDGEKKANLLQNIIIDKNIDAKNTIAIGDGANDLPMMAIAGFSIAYKAKAIVEEQASISIKKCGLDIVILLK